MRSNALSLVFLSTCLISCGSSSSSPSSQPIPEKSYQFAGDGCDTGPHVFSGHDQHSVLLEYCRTLLSDELNNACAAEERTRRFDEDCQSVRGELISDQTTEPTTDPGAEKPKANKTYYGILEPNAELDYLDLIQSTHSIQVSVTYLDIFKLDDYIFRAEENLQTQASNIFVALRDCGFYLVGPHCREGQVSEKIWDQLLKINGTTFYYIVSEYSDYPLPVAYFFELDNERNYAPTGNLYIYVLNNRQKSHAPQDLLLEATGTAVGKAQFKPMNIDSRFETLQFSEVSQEILATSNWLLDQKEFITESSFQDLSEKILKILPEKKTFISDARNGRSIYYYLLTLQRLMSEENFRAMLEKLTKGASKDLFTLQSALFQLSLGINSEENILLSKIALQSKDKYTFLRAIDALIKTGITLEDQDINQLINALVHKDSEIALHAFNALKVVGVDPKYLSVLDEKIQGKVPDHSPELVISLIASLVPDKKALELLISYMSHPQEFTRKVAYTIIENTTFDNTALPYFKKQMSSTYPETRIAVAYALVKINTYESIKLIIENVSDPLGLNRTTLLDILSHYTYSDQYINPLQAQFKSPYLDVRIKMFELIFSIGTKSAYEAVIRNLSDPDEAFRGIMIAVLDKMTLTADFVPALTSGFYSKYTDVKLAVTRYIISIPGREATAAIIRNLGQSDVNIRTALLDELKNRNLDDSYIADLKTQFYSYYPDVKETVFDYIIAMGTDKSKLTLIDNMANSTESIRQKIITYLDSTEMKNDYLSNLKWAFTSAYYLDVRLAIVNLIGKLDSVDATLILINIMDAYESLVREAIFKKLETRTMTTACISPLKLQLSDYYADVRIATASLLAKIPSPIALDALKYQLKYEREIAVKTALNKAISELEAILALGGSSRLLLPSTEILLP